MLSDTKSAEGSLLDWMDDASLRRYAARLLGNPADVDDVLQIVAEKLLAQTSTVRQPQHYLRRAVRNAAIDHQRASVLRADYERRSSIHTEPLDNAAETALIVACIQRALRKLPVLTAEMFRLHYLDGLSQRAIAERFGVHLSSVEKRLAQSRRCCLAAVQALAFED